MALDRQAIERRDFPIGRRGYDPGAVDQHLREVAVAFAELEQAGKAGESSVAASAGLQVQGIIAAAEKAAADIEREAREKVQQTRDEALMDAARIREDAIAQGRTLVAAVTQATSVLLERVGSMDGELAALVENLRAGATRLSGDLAAVKGNMGELYDAASAHTSALSKGADAPSVPGAPARELDSSGPAEAEPEHEEMPASDPLSNGPISSGPGATAAPPEPAETPQAEAEPATDAPASKAPTWGSDEQASPPAAEKEQDSDLDGARLIALNMALNGEPRAAADRYLAEHFELSDRSKLIDEVYAAIEA